MTHRLSAIGLGVVLCAIPLAALDLPKPAPELVIRQVDGQQLLLSHFRGKVVAVDTPENLQTRLHGSQAIYVQVDAAGASTAPDLLGSVPGVLRVSESDRTPTAVHAKQYAKIVERKAVLRGLIGAAGRIASIGYRPRPLTGEVDVLPRLEKAGASAIVLPSLFEEQITVSSPCAHGDSLGERSAFRQEAISGVDRIAAGLSCGRDDGIDREVALCAGWWSDHHDIVCESRRLLGSGQRLVEGEKLS